MQTKKLHRLKQKIKEIDTLTLYVISIIILMIFIHLIDFIKHCIL